LEYIHAALRAFFAASASVSRKLSPIDITGNGYFSRWASEGIGIPVSTVNIPLVYCVQLQPVQLFEAVYVDFFRVY
jgi:hypothetical protein